jgi:drug/metabolite transporter (DMT)-like permease
VASAPTSISVEARPASGLRHLWPYAAVLLAAAMWGTIGTSYALILDRVDTDPVTVVTIRAASAAILLWGFLLLRDRPAARVAPRDLPGMVLFGLVTVTVFYVALIYAFEWTSVAVGTVLLYLAPSLVMVGAVVYLDEPVTRRKLAALGLALTGCLLVVRAYDPSRLAGDAKGLAMCLLSAVTYGAYSLVGKGWLRRYRPLTILAHSLLVGAVGLFALKLALSAGEWPEWQGILLIGAYNGIVTTLLPVSLYTIGLSKLPSSEASILATMEPVVAVILAATILGEALAWPQALGAALVLAGVVLLASRARVRASRVPVAEA